MEDPQEPVYPSQLQVDVVAPCEKSHLVEKDNSTGTYVGTAGDFAHVVLSSSTSAGGIVWTLETTDFTVGSGCYGVKTFRRDPAGDDPRGSYSLLVSGTPDSSAGTALVTDVA